jgi:uncharacterized protein
MKNLLSSWLRFGLSFLLLLLGTCAFAGEKDFPDKPSPPRLVNDLAGMMTQQEQDLLEAKLREFERTTSNEITIVTIKNLGEYDVSDYAIQLGKRWGVGKSGKNNGVVILASLEDHKINISTGKGLEGALTDLTSGRIIRNEMVPAFKRQDYYLGFNKAADAIIAATKGEYQAEKTEGKGRHLPATALIIIVIIIIFIIRISRRGGGGGGNYMSGGGFSNLATGFFLGNLLGGGRGGGWGSSGGGGDWGGGGGGGFGGFGGGDFGGGGASGSW